MMMKEELQSKLVEILTSIQTATGKAADFAMDQLPDIAQSYIVYGRASRTVFSIVLTGMAIALLWRLFWNARNPKLDKYGIRVESQQMAMACQGVLGLLSTISALLEMQGALLVWLAPKVWLLKELAGLIK